MAWQDLGKVLEDLPRSSKIFTLTWVSIKKRTKNRTNCFDPCCAGALQYASIPSDYICSEFNIWHCSAGNSLESDLFSHC